MILGSELVVLHYITEDGTEEDATSNVMNRVMLSTSSFAGEGAEIVAAAATYLHHRLHSRFCVTARSFHMHILATMYDDPAKT